MFSRFALAAMLLFGLAGCRTFDPKHPSVGKPEIESERTGYWIWYEENAWHVRMTAGSHAHRFQGSMAGVRGGVVDLALTRASLKEGVAIGGDAVQFDVELAVDDGQQGFDAHVIGGCARFDLLVDGHHPDSIRLGPRALPARHSPFERCP
jgi:hypothetical protein